MSTNSATKCPDHPQIKILEYRSFPLKLRKIHRQHTKMLFQLIKVILRVVSVVFILNLGSPMSDCSHSSRISGELIPSTSKSSTKNRHYRGGRIRSGPYEKYKDESGKIKVEEVHTTSGDRSSHFRLTLSPIRLLMLMGKIVKIPIADWLLYLPPLYINNGFGLSNFRWSIELLPVTILG